MATTFETYAGERAGNYSTLPTADVEILPDVYRCLTCLERITWLSDLGTFGGWAHGSKVTDHAARPLGRCRYCHSHDVITKHYTWHDATECGRCGGIDGWAIGD